jgi:hypothetical protein
MSEKGRRIENNDGVTPWCPLPEQMDDEEESEEREEENEDD